MSPTNNLQFGKFIKVAGMVSGISEILEHDKMCSWINNEYQAYEKLFIHANYSFVDLTQITLYRSTPEIVVRDTSGDNPRHLGAVLVNYVTESDLSLSAMLNYQSTIYHRIDEDNASYARLDLKAAKSWQVKNTQAQLSLTVQNLGEQYRERYFYNQFKTRVILGMQLDF